MARGAVDGEQQDALGVRAGRGTARPPHTRAVRGETAGGGPDDGAWSFPWERSETVHPSRTVRRRTRQRLLADPRRSNQGRVGRELQCRRIFWITSPCVMVAMIRSDPC